MKNTMNKYDKYLMYFNTIQGTPMKTLTESLKEVLIDINIYFDENGFEVINMDANKVSFVALKLYSDKFEEYYCPKPIVIGVNMTSLYKLLKTIGNNDTLSMYVTKAEPDKLGIIIQNKKKRIYNKITYNLKDIDQIEIDIPDIDYDAQITMPCSDFQKYCRELATISNFMDIGIKPNKKIFTLSVEGDFASQSLDIEESEDSNITINVDKSLMEYSDSDDSDDHSDSDSDYDNPVNIGRFSLKFLNLFCKSSTLCNTIQLYLKREFPIVIVYSVASLGTVRFNLCPQIVEDYDE